VEWVETTGRTVEEAKELALDQLGVADEDAEFEVLDEPRTGLFGRLKTEARVRARVRPTRPRPKIERRERRPRRPPSGERGTVAVAPAPPAGRTTPPPPAKEIDMAEQTDRAVHFLEGLLDAFGLEATFDHVADGDDVEVRVHGDDLGILIGPRGQTLSSIQDLTRLAAQREAGREGRLHIDIGGYRERRRHALEKFARDVAAEVISTGEARALEPMSAADRKVVHDTAATIEGIQTSSEGEEPQRRVVIRPV
jgi:spoIIIJ-associated protein